MALPVLPHTPKMMVLGGFVAGGDHETWRDRFRNFGFNNDYFLLNVGFPAVRKVEVKG